MYRKNLREKLERYNPSDEHEIYYKKQMLEFLNNKDCFERSLAFGHFTGSCWFENYDGSKFLLTLHKKLKSWFQLGGHADGDSDILRVALKEAHEESGINHIELVSNDIFDISVHLVPDYKNIPAHYHYDVRFFVRASDPKENIQISDESDDLRWFSEPLNDGNAEIHRMFGKWKQFKRKNN